MLHHFKNQVEEKIKTDEKTEKFILQKLIYIHKSEIGLHCKLKSGKHGKKIIILDYL
jgi:hypothetical protein